jgi:outer membrane lipase/esterase
MLRTLQAATVAAIALIGAPQAHAATFDDYTGLLVLGDSLSDTGRIYDLTSSIPFIDPVPESPPYYEGRFSDGPVWAEHLAAEFEADGKPTINKAWGGAEASGFNNPVPDLRVQAAEFVLTEWGSLGARPLVTMWAGANDLFTTIDDGDAEAAGRQGARTIGEVAGYLAEVGLNDFLLLNLPDLGKIPRYLDTDLEDEATSATLAFNETLLVEAEALMSAGVNVTYVDAFAHFGEIIENPAAYGLSNVTTACYLDGVVCAAPEEHLFFDRMHPSAKGHQIIAEKAISYFRDEDLVAVIPVPAPAALLLGALLVLGGFGRIGRSRPA